MEIVCSTLGIVDTERPAQGISDIANAGFMNISLDVMIHCSGSEPESLRKDNYQKMIGQCQEKGVQLLVARAPRLIGNTKCTNVNDFLIRFTEESIRLSGKAGCRYHIVPPLLVGVKRGEEWEINREYYLGFAQTARENGVMILLENQCRSLNGHMVRGICSDGRIAAEWVDELNREVGEERFGFCVDIGVCNLCAQDMYEFIHILGKRVKAVIIRDCNGHDESSMLPFTCVSKRQSQTNWLSLIRGLREIVFDGVMVLDMEDTASAFSPLLRPQLLVLARSVMDFLNFQVKIERTLQKYKHIVLFGAGNMCRNFIKCYGEKYKPLFTCDNNRSLWGTEFCGLEVKPPEVLKDLPDDCGVFICNIYYREIEDQLKQMGVHEIEFFNDEYMPSFYFDRINRG